jgi:hypothetical protein
VKVTDSPAQIELSASLLLSEAVGVAFTVTVKDVPTLSQLLVFLTLMVPLYVPAGALAGIAMVSGLAAGMAVYATSAKPAAFAAAS